MSFWTHVNGSLRVDNPYIECDKRFKKCTHHMDTIFHTAHFGGGHDQWAACNVPCGSEGSLDVVVWHNPHKYHEDQSVVSFFGDLRGYEESQHKDIVKWIDGVIKKNHWSIRDGVMTINEKVYRLVEHRDENFDIISLGFELVYTSPEEK